MKDERDHYYSKIYTPLDEIRGEIEKRRSDPVLTKKVQDFFRENAFEAMSKGPFAVMSTSIATPNMEMERFLSFANEINLPPLILEYPDKFVAKNLHKYHLCKLFFLKNLKTEKRISTVHTLKLVDFNKEEGRVFTDIRTNWGEKIITTHHKFLFSKHPSLVGSILDFSIWFKKSRASSDYYYLYYISLFIRDGVLFENFLVDDKEEAQFFHDKFYPSFIRAQELFGVKPIICQLLPSESEKSSFWYSYPDSCRPLFISQLLGKSAIISRWSLTFSKISSIAARLFRKCQIF